MQTCVCLNAFADLKTNAWRAENCAGSYSIGAVRQAVSPGILLQISKLSEEGDK